MHSIESGPLNNRLEGINVILRLQLRVRRRWYVRTKVVMMMSDTINDGAQVSIRGGPKWLSVPRNDDLNHGDSVWNVQFFPQDRCNSLIC